MPTYAYLCKGCGLDFETQQSFDEDPLVACRECGEDALVRVLFPPVIFDATPRTLGTLAERNTARAPLWAEAERHRVAEKRKKGVEEINQSLPKGMTSAREERPSWLAKPDPKVNQLSPDQKANYIMTGDSRG